LIREDIIKCFKGTGLEPTLDQVAARLGLTCEALVMRLASETPLEDLAGLSMDETLRVLRQFAGFAVFSADLEKAVTDFAFDATRRRIQEMERKALGEGK
jgi:hypothetical protein